MFCSKCGKENADDALYCRTCGNQLGKKKKSSSAKFIAKALLLLVVLFGIGFVIKTFVLSGDFSLSSIVEKKDTEKNNSKSISNIKSEIKRIKPVFEYEIDYNVPMLGNYNGSGVIFNINENDVETVKFGKYPQSDISGKKMEDIEWYVVYKENDKALLLSKYILDNRTWNTVNEIINWPNSNIRKFLNEEFYNKAFSNKEKEIIVSAEHNMEYNYYENNPYSYMLNESSWDKVFILSRSEIQNYRINEKLDNNFHGNQVYRCYETTGTEYAKNVIDNGSKLYIADTMSFYNDRTIGTSNWWIRSCDGEFKFVYHNGNDGVSYVDGYRGLRPAIWVEY